MSLGVLAVLGLVSGLGTEGGLPVWQVCAWVVLAVLAYLHGRHVDARFGWQVLTGVAIAGTATVAVLDRAEVPTVLVVLLITIVLPWLGGRYRRQQALLVAAEQERVRQLEREQEHVAERARLQERGRLAAELHDSLGHDLALIALRGRTRAVTGSGQRGRPHGGAGGGRRRTGCGSRSRCCGNATTCRRSRSWWRTRGTRACPWRSTASPTCRTWWTRPCAGSCGRR
ncbi:hypothetical protein BBK82_41485 [Lentzea guizhouensis]|uniref:histidine kinase n=1 Tax=Lentzea guizhouensis TaxID=1586287 RepID=A0A1B2HUU6_9PSEU|nr:histidine kinase [Lentzea guizhouensis]ANZ41473.1 hypothetical protein BBK82_41485 [Lentzea guizhouensis]